MTEPVLSLRIGPKSAQILAKAMRIYADELEEIVHSIVTAARESNLGDEDYVPQELLSERELVSWWSRFLVSERIDGFSVINVGAELGAVAHSACLLQLEDLRLAYRIHARDPLTPPEALLPRQHRIAAIEDEVSRIWAQFGLSPGLPRVRAQHAMKRSGAAWQPLLQWLATQPDGRPRTWCFCDTTFFLESQALFSEVDWHKAWGFERVVLVVPQAMLRELDARKGDPRRDNITRRKRAIKALAVLDAFAEGLSASAPVSIRPGVELLVLDHERSPELATLDGSQPDDRLIDAALDFQQHLPGEVVVIVTDDRGPRFKARRYGLHRRDLGEYRRPQVNVG